jgi:hypothetical protein
MAKLSAHGSTELARFTRVTPDTEDPTVVRRVTYSLRSDGRVLVRYDGSYPSSDGTRKLRGTWTRAVSPTRRVITFDPARAADYITRCRAHFIPLGFTEGDAPISIPESRDA